MSETYEYRTRTNGDVELIHDGALAKLLSGDEAKTFLAQAKDGDVQEEMARLVGARAEGAMSSQDQGHPALDDPLPGPTPHGDGAVREKDGEEKPSD